MPAFRRGALSPDVPLNRKPKYKDFAFWMEWLPPYMQILFQRQLQREFLQRTKMMKENNIRKIHASEILNTTTTMLDLIVNPTVALRDQRDALSSLKIMIQMSVTIPTFENFSLPWFRRIDDILSDRNFFPLLFRRILQAGMSANHDNHNLESFGLLNVLDIVENRVILVSSYTITKYSHLFYFSGSIGSPSSYLLRFPASPCCARIVGSSTAHWFRRSVTEVLWPDGSCYLRWFLHKSLALTSWRPLAPDWIIVSPPKPSHRLFP